MEPIVKTIQKIQIKPTPFNIIVTPKISSIEKPMRGVYGKHDTSGSKIAIGSQKGLPGDSSLPRLVISCAL